MMAFRRDGYSLDKPTLHLFAGLRPLAVSAPGGWALEFIFTYIIDFTFYISSFQNFPAYALNSLVPW